VVNGLMWGTIIGFLLVVYHIIRSLLMRGSGFNFDIGLYTWIHRILLIGLTEEVVFRGFILQKLNEELEFAFANSISAVLFLLIHFPGWYASGLLSQDNMTYFYLTAAFVLVFGLVQGYVLKKTKSLWACMVIHSINNLIVTIVGV
jgi:membrane protease YdiL (CAAX protease family)